jgi:hypothetical protein
MKKLITYFLILLTIFTFSGGVVFAQTYREGKTVTLGQNRTVNQNYFATGETIILEGTVNGDAYLAAGNIIVNGTVNGDLMAAGGNITINGTVAEDLRVAAGSVSIQGQIGGGVTVMAGSVTVARDSQVAEGLVAAGGNLDIMAPIGGGITVGAGNVLVGNTVNGNALVGAGKLTLTNNANITGNLDYYSESRLTRTGGARVGGNVKFNRVQDIAEKGRAEERVRKGVGAFGASMLFMSFVGLISSFVLGALLIKLMPNFMAKTAETVGSKSWQSMLLGLAVLFLTPIVALVLLMTVIGMPLAFILMLAYILILYISKLFTSIYVGKIFIKAKDASLYLLLFLGLLVYYLVGLIPIIGWISSLLFVITGIGAYLLQKQEEYKTLRVKKQI